jgi:hypothetical protein
LTAVVSYDFVVPAIADRFLPSTGQAFVVALGVGNGLMSLSHIIKFGKSTSESRVWTSESSVVSLNSRGSARQLLLVVSAFGVGSVSLAITYVAPNVSSAVFNAPASGSVSMSIFGTSFSVGNSGAARFGGSAVFVSSWRSDSYIYVKIASGSSSRLGLYLSVSLQVGQKDDVQFYNQPTPSKLLAVPATTGTSLISVVAANLGSVCMSIGLQLKMTSDLVGFCEQCPVQGKFWIFIWPRHRSQFWDAAFLDYSTCILRHSSHNYERHRRSCCHTVDWIFISQCTWQFPFNQLHFSGHSIRCKFELGNFLDCRH